jgi:8-oxo-dGTP pyrophosphatase MutT (NUDIX family)
MYNIQKSNLVYKSPWLQVYEDSVRYKDNNSHSIKIFNRIKVADTVIIIPIFEDGSLLMVEGYRHGAGDNLLEFPGGFIEENEGPSQAAKRELFEETKHICDSLELMNWFYTWPGRTSQKNYVFVAKGLKNKKDNDNINNHDTDILIGYYILHHIIYVYVIPIVRTKYSRYRNKNQNHNFSE